jgi:hypothetical protein
MEGGRAGDSESGRRGGVDEDSLFCPDRILGAVADGC